MGRPVHYFAFCEVVTTGSLQRLQSPVGDAIKDVNVSFDDGVKAGKHAAWEGSLGFNQFMSEDTKLASTDLAKMKIDWEPSAIVYADGTTMSDSGVAAGKPIPPPIEVPQPTPKVSPPSGAPAEPAKPKKNCGLFVLETYPDGSIKSARQATPEEQSSCEAG